MRKLWDKFVDFWKAERVLMAIVIADLIAAVMTIAQDATLKAIFFTVNAIFVFQIYLAHEIRKRSLDEKMEG